MLLERDRANLQCETRSGKTPLICAAEFGAVEIFRLLLQPSRPQTLDNLNQSHMQPCLEPSYTPQQCGDGFLLDDGDVNDIKMQS